MICWLFKASNLTSPMDDLQGFAALQMPDTSCR
jgi:hypothetical protein